MAPRRHARVLGCVPGIRLVAWTTSCMFRCRYCHNPDTWKLANGIPVTLQAAIEEIRKYAYGLKQMHGGFTLSGTKLFVPDAHVADALIVVARTREGKNPEEGVSLFLVPKGTKGLSVKLLPTMDQTRKLCEVRLTDVNVAADALVGAKDGGWTPLARVIERATVALCAEMCGGAQRVLDMTTEYAKIRIAFGKPIGSYQGVKHRAADMLVDVENAKSLTYYAAWAVDENVPESALACSMAKAYTSDAYRKVSGAGIQLHGGIGVTWEHDLHLYFKRAKSSEFTFGDATYHREKVAQLISL